MITLDQYLRGEVPREIRDNAVLLLSKVNTFLQHVGGEYPMTSGFRSPAHNKTIGGAKRSKHMSGQAVDIADPEKVLARLCLIYAKTLEEIGLWCEDMRATSTWVHFQSVPPTSGKRFFLPSNEWAAKLHEPLTLEAL